MVATRRGVRVSSPAKTSTDQSSDVPPTPSTGRRTRRTAKGAESPTHHVLVETSSQLEKKETTPPASPPTSLMKRCTRASRLHSPEQPCTPVGSTHEADVSDLESCCSTRSDIEPASTRTRSRRKPAPVVSQEDEEISEVESYSSVSRQKVVRSSRRSTRKTTVAPEKSDPAHVEAGDVNVDKALESKSCNSVVSESNRATRSQRRTTRTRSSAKQQTEDSEVSDADSCASSVSGVSKSSTRRPAKPRRQINPIPLDLQDPSEGSQSPAPTGRRTRATRGKAAATTDVSEPQSCDSEGFESGPSYSMSTRRQGKAKTVDSDSEPTDLHSPMSSPCSTRSRGTPCSSRTGSGNSSRGASASRRSLKDLSIVLERASELIEEDISLNDSRLETTVIAADADCTLLEEDDSQTLEEKVGANSADVSSNEVDTKTVEEGEKKEVVGDDQPVVMVIDQQEELSAENKDGDTSEMEGMQEMIQSSVPSQPSVTVTVREKVIEITEEEGDYMEVSGVGTQPSQGEKAADEDAVEEIQASTEERMEVTAQINTDAQQVVEAESIRVTSKHQDKTVRLDFDSEQKPEQKDIVVQKTKVISLLDSSDDEDVEEEDDDDDEEVEEEEDERGGPSKKPEAAASSVDGLFMIDTRPGEEADEHYFTERPTTEHEEATNKDAEQDEEFVDEEGDDDDEDDDADILFSSRNPQAKELSSCIDPGIRVKELGGLYINFDGSKSKPVSSSLQKLKEKKIQDELMKKSIIGPDFEKKDAVPPYSESKRALKLKHKEEREKTTGDGWFNMKAPEIDQEQKRDLQVLKMRGALDPKRFYKKNDRDGFPKYFQVGTVVDSAVDFYHSRIPKKQRKRTIVEELLADAEFRHNNKKKYKQIVTEKAAQAAGKRSRKKNKFHKK